VRLFLKKCDIFKKSAIFFKKVRLFLKKCDIFKKKVLTDVTKPVSCMNYRGFLRWSPMKNTEFWALIFGFLKFGRPTKIETRNGPEILILNWDLALCGEFPTKDGTRFWRTRQNVQIWCCTGAVASTMLSLLISYFYATLGVAIYQNRFGDESFWGWHSVRTTMLDWWLDFGPPPWQCWLCQCWLIAS
jgi:hypothetical protein